VIDPPALFVTLAAPLSLMPSALAEDTLPELVTVQGGVVAAAPSMPSFPTPVEVTVPALVMVSGLSVTGFRVTGPVTLVLIVLDIYLTLISTQQFPELALVAARPLNPSASNSPH
jgi:hypothetical protein